MASEDSLLNLENQGDDALYEQLLLQVQIMYYNVTLGQSFTYISPTQ